MRSLKFLVVEGNLPEVRERTAAFLGRDYGHDYGVQLCELAPGSAYDVLYGAKPEAPLPSLEDLRGYDGLVIGGSALNLPEAAPEALHQVEIAKRFFESGRPFLRQLLGLAGRSPSCWRQGAPPRSTATRLWRRATSSCAATTPSSQASRAPLTPPPSTWTNSARSPPIATGSPKTPHSPYQALEIRHADGACWAVQYHPEFSLRHMAGNRPPPRAQARKPRLLCGRRGGGSGGGGAGGGPPGAEQGALVAPRADGGDHRCAPAPGREIANWIEHAVRPAA